MRQRLNEHIYNAARRPKESALYAAIAKYGRDEFSIHELCCAQSIEDIQAIEALLINQWQSIAPLGYNLTLGGEGRFGYRPSAASVERSAAKHRGNPCHPNTRKVSSEFHKGRKRSSETRRKISEARKGVPRSDEMKAKLSAYWAARRKRGEFKTLMPYAHCK